MIYIFDTNALSTIFRFYYATRFPTFWTNFNEAKDKGEIISVREVRNEITDKYIIKDLYDFAKKEAEFFHDPTTNEMTFIGQIYSIPHFQQNIEHRNILLGKPIADPFLIAKARESDGTVVTMEQYKDNAAKIPNICRHFDIRCMNLEEFMIEKAWEF